MNDAAVDLSMLMGLGLCLVEYEALLAVGYMFALDEESQSLGHGQCCWFLTAKAILD